MKSVVHAACPHDCPDACGVLITVEDGRATRIQGDPAHPITRGFLCAKVAKYVDRVYSPDRVLFPLRRVKPKGEGGFSAFEQISWDEALDTIASRFKSISTEFGPEAILPYSYGGTLGAVQGTAMDHRFFHRLGASQLNRTICSEAGGLALTSLFGLKLGTEPEQFRHSRYIIAWGANIHGNNIHLWPFIEEARRNGAKLVVIDPYRTRTATCADWYLPINPGTDGALAIAMLYVIIEENLYDADYIARYTEGFDQLRAQVKEFTPEHASRFTGINPDDIRRLAREYATTRPAVIRMNYGVQRAENGGMTARAIAMLPCITGSWQEAGGGLQLSTSGAFRLNKDAQKRADLMQKSLGRPARVLNMVELGRDLLERTQPPIKALFVFNCNPAAVCPNHNAVIAGLKRDDLFTVVHEQFLTDTTDYADIVLPATTFFEHKDLQTSYGHYFIQISNAAIPPVGEARSNSDVFRELAVRLGLEDGCLRESDDQIIDSLLASGHEWMEGITRERLEREAYVRLNFPGGKEFRPFAQGFPTPTGKAMLYNSEFEKQGLNPVVSFTPPVESRHTKNQQFPLELLARKADNYMNSTFCNLPIHQQLERPIDVLEMNAIDAATRGIEDGDTVRVFNHRGDLKLKALVSDGVQPGVVAARLNWAKLSANKTNINALVSDRLTDMGEGPTFYSVLVEVAKETSDVAIQNPF